ncbi:type II toxin-antitoxin system RelB/DinJ family antitoxin [Companilactobacillus mindensis]|nr:type II toxin-antitoxin system RelB/DinJ family antitoxin [Companilactobacillus mindensis]
MNNTHEGNDKTKIQTYITKELKKDSEKVLESMGLSINDAIKILLNRIVATDSLLLNLTLPEVEKDRISIAKSARNLPVSQIKIKEELTEWLKV